MNKIKKEWLAVTTALAILTNFRKDLKEKPSITLFEHASLYFPVAGWITGIGMCFFYLLFSRFISNDAGILACITSEVLITRGLHEAGFARSLHAMGESKSSIDFATLIKEKSVSSYGVIGLVLIIAAKFITLRELPQFTPDIHNPTSNIVYNYRYFFLIIITGSTASRWMMSLLVQVQHNAEIFMQPYGYIVSRKKISVIRLAIPTILSLIPLIFLSWHFLLAIIPMIYITYEIASFFNKKMKGYTIESLGLVQQITEIVFFLSVIIIWRYIL